MVAAIMTNLEIPPKLPNQLVGNMGLFYVCFELSKSGWNCLPTSRNAKGIDLAIYSQDAKKLSIGVRKMEGNLIGWKDLPMKTIKAIGMRSERCLTLTIHRFYAVKRKVRV
jgi:hypothetical protein